MEQMRLFTDSVCYQEEVRDATRIPEVLNRVILKALRGSAPAQINIPRDMWTQVIDVDLPQIVRFERPAGGEGAVTEAARLLSEARFPVILSGAGVVLSGAIPDLTALAERLDALHGGHDHVLAVSQARASLHAPDTLPSARVLRAMAQEHGDSFIGFIKAQSAEIHRQLLALPWSAKQQARFEAMAEQSVHDQRAIETADTMPFEIYRQEYVSPERLGRPRSAPAPQTQATALPIP